MKDKKYTVSLDKISISKFKSVHPEQSYADLFFHPVALGSVGVRGIVSKHFFAEEEN